MTFTVVSPPDIYNLLVSFFSLIFSIRILPTFFASFATDGIDGYSNAAGAIADGFSLKRALKKEYDPSYFLKNNDSYKFFKLLNDLIKTGPTGTNIMDIQLIIC